MPTPRALRPAVLAATLVVPAAIALLPMASAAQSVPPSALPTAPMIAPGTALVSVTGDIETTLVLPLVPGTAMPTGAGFDLRFQDATLDTLNVTLTVDADRVTDTFVGVGVPGTSIFDAAYFADFLHTQCGTTVVSLDASGIHALIDCAGLENGAGDATIDLHAELTTIGLASPSGSPASDSPMPTAPDPSPLG